MNPGMLAAFALVPATLITIAGLCALLGVLWLLSRLVAPPPQKAKPVAASLPAAAPAPVAVRVAASDELSPDDPRLIAIITAAATAALGRSAVVTRLTFTNRSSTSWSQFGRADIHMSHRVR